MGYIVIQTAGSFPKHGIQFNAMQNGHAHAVAEAIQFLSEVVLPAAIEQDHRLHERRVYPDQGNFDRKSVST